MKIKFIVKEVGKDFEIKEHDEKNLPSQEIGCDVVSSFCIGKNLYCFYDDIGFINYMNGKSEYNFNLPSGKVENKIFGKAIFIRVDKGGYDVDVLYDDLLYIKDNTYYKEVDDDYIKSMNEIIDSYKEIFKNI